MIDTFRKLVESGDRVLRIEGCVSGTLGFVLSSLDPGTSFSAAVREAMARGYTEPDPREDLSGRDAARKGLILARLLGFAARRRARRTSCRARSRRDVQQFLARLPALDGAWRSAWRARPPAAACCATSCPRHPAVAGRPAAVPRDSAFGSLQGTRNLLSFTTRRYRAEPLVVTGPGAGAEVTAAGILNDIHSLGSD